ncbi:hypothetical protein V5O48_010597 [Marasmius crinis-equi]|uniref:Altered inheritance of mitochondria protein 24, mitochondrial n=1 Tax=Marasmius crinis-equi TaxID=585013 RepID=A0ABR3F8H7_9AGAR
MSQQTHFQPPTQPTNPQPQFGMPTPQEANIESGSFQGGNYRVTHRHTNSILTLDLANGHTIRARPGAMVHMGPQVDLQGNFKFSFKKMFTGGSMNYSTFSGSGPVALAPLLFGDITTIPVRGDGQWNISKHAFLACTQDVVRESKSQGFMKAIFGGEDLFIYQISGSGMLWVSSFGAIERIDLREGQEHIVDNGHLVAWSCQYQIEKAGGGTMNSLKSGEGVVCRFRGPGAIYCQTRNQDDFEEYIVQVAKPRNSGQ